MNNNIFLKLSALLLAACCVCCGVSNDKPTQNIDKPTSEQIFKTWLRDTLENLHQWEKTAEENVTNKKVIIGRDSLTLVTETLYSSSIQGDKRQVGEIGDMIATLGEYNELPSNPFMLSFLYQVFFQPSSVEQLPYDFIYEIKDIVMVEGKTTTKFNFIRGRLSGKEATTIAANGKPQVIRTEFIWDGDSLLKKEQ